MKMIGKIIIWLLTAILLTFGLLFLLDVPLPGKQLNTETDTTVKEDELDTLQTSQIEKTQQSDRSNVEETEVEQTDTVQKKDADTVQKSDSGTKTKEKELVLATVEDDYFSDALFIGDSRTVGMQDSGLLPEATYYAKTGIGIGEILDSAIIYENGMMLTIPQALQMHTFGKVYIMIGINDMSQGGVDWFLEKYQEILDVVQSTQPEAVIYIQGNIPMSYYKQEAGTSDGSLTNANLRDRNAASRTLTDDKTIFYLDIQDIYADSYGNLNTNYTTDGLHVQLNYYSMWVDYLKQHARVWSEGADE